jgi:excisionase family DNA binding protein
MASGESLSLSLFSISLKPITMSDTPSKLVQFKDVAEHFDVSVQTVRTWVREKKIPFQQIGKVYRFKISDIENALSNKHVEEDDDEEEMSEEQIQSGMNRVRGLGMLWYRRAEYRKQISTIIKNRPFRQRVISHLFTGIPVRLTVEEIALVFQVEVEEMKKIISMQHIMLHPRYFSEELQNALMEEYDKVNIEDED